LSEERSDEFFYFNEASETSDNFSALLIFCFFFIKKKEEVNYFIEATSFLTQGRTEKRIKTNTAIQ